MPNISFIFKFIMEQMNKDDILKIIYYKKIYRSYNSNL